MLDNFFKKINKYRYFYGWKITFLLFLEQYLDRGLKKRKVNHYPYPNYLVIYNSWMNKVYELPLVNTLITLIQSLFTPYQNLSISNSDLPYPKQIFKIKLLQESNVIIIYDDFKAIPVKITQSLLTQAKTVKIKPLTAKLTAKEILTFDAIFLYQLPWKFKLYQYLRYAYLNYIPSFYWIDQISDNQQIKSTLSSTDFILTCQSKVYDYYIQEYSQIISVKNNVETLGISEAFTQATASYKKKYFPKVSLVIFFFKFSSELSAVLTSYLQQTYQGEWEIIFINKLSSPSQENSFNALIKNTFKSENVPECKIIQSDDSKNTQYTWQKILEIASGDLLIFLRNDYIIDPNFITNHVVHHAFNDCDIGIGKTQNYSCELEDTLNPNSFVNLIKFNFSLKRNLLNSIIANCITTFSLDYNWMTVELGFLLYKKGVKFKQISEAICTPSVSLEYSYNQPIAKQIKNLNTLTQKYPEINLVARRWQTKIRSKLYRQLSSFYPPKAKYKKIKILTYPWHIAHQYELYKLPYEFTLITDLGSPQSQGWNLSHRPIHHNIEFCSIEDINTQDFDLAILHFDENVLTPELTQGIIGKDWGLTFKYFCEQIDLPKVAICHGTPQFYGQYDLNYQQPNLTQDIEDSKKQLVEYLGDILTITNSYQANQEWGFKKTKVIWHGFDPLEFPSTTYRKGILAPFDQSVTSRPHYRGLSIYRQVFQDFPSEYSPSTLQVQEPPVIYLGNQYAEAKFRNYVDNIRQYSIFFNPTLRSPMPRLRGESMMCGLVTVSLKNHDIDLFISNGVNGFYSSDPLELRDYLLFLVNNLEQTQKIGQRSRELAMDIFNHDRYLKEWQDTIISLI